MSQISSPLWSLIGQLIDSSSQATQWPFIVQNCMTTLTKMCRNWTQSTSHCSSTTKFSPSDNSIEKWFRVHPNRRSFDSFAYHRNIFASLSLFVSLACQSSYRCMSIKIGRAPVTVAINNGMIFFYFACFKRMLTYNIFSDRDSPEQTEPIKPPNSIVSN